MSKIASKQIVPATATGKTIHVEEEEVDDDLNTTASSKQSKATAKVTKEIKKSK